MEKKHYYFIGIGGVGMGALATLCLARGYRVSGSDVNKNSMTRQLSRQGAQIYVGHDASQLEAVDSVIYSSAIAPDNVEWLTARTQQIHCMHRAELLADLMTSQKGIAVCGTHGKTTTTGMLTRIFQTAGLQPSFVIGGCHQDTGLSAAQGRGGYFIAEADESDESFRALNPEMVLVTNIDHDHLETYDGDFSRLCASFCDFVNALPNEGFAVLCWDNLPLRTMAEQYQGQVIRYGEHPEADCRLLHVRQVGTNTHFVLQWQKKLYEFCLPQPGLHNAQNACGAVALALQCGVPMSDCQRAIAQFCGMGRRFQIHGEYTNEAGASAIVVEDYAHHPTEIAATIQAARASWPEQRVVLVFQPHRYSRTQRHYGDFVDVLSMADYVLLTDIYAAGELPIEGVSAQQLCQDLREQSVPVRHIPDLHAMPAPFDQVACDGDVWLFVGAGSVGRHAQMLCASAAL